MPDHNAYGQAVQAGIAAVILLMVVRPILKSAFAELFRQRVFELRRAMFLEYVDGGIAAGRAYRLMTTTMNAVIRYAEHAAFGRAFLGRVFSGRSYELDAVDDVEVALEETDEESRTVLRKYRAKLYYEIARQMLLTSPLLWALIAVLLPVAAVLSLFRVLDVTRSSIAHVVSRVGRLTSVRRIASDARALLSDDVTDDGLQAA